MTTTKQLYHATNQYPIMFWPWKRRCSTTNVQPCYNLTAVKPYYNQYTTILQSQSISQTIIRANIQRHVRPFLLCQGLLPGLSTNQWAAYQAHGRLGCGRWKEEWHLKERERWPQITCVSVGSVLTVFDVYCDGLLWWNSDENINNTVLCTQTVGFFFPYHQYHHQWPECVFFPFLCYYDCKKSAWWYDLCYMCPCLTTQQWFFINIKY